MVALALSCSSPRNEPVPPAGAAPPSPSGGGGLFGGLLRDAGGGSSVPGDPDGAGGAGGSGIGPIFRPDAASDGAGGISPGNIGSGGTGIGGTGAGGAGGGTVGGPVPPAPEPPVADVTAFLGTWEFTSGSETWNCEVSGPSVESLSGTFQLEKGVDAPLWEFAEPCTFRLDVSGATATYRTAPPCSFAEGESSYVVTPVGGTILVSGDVAVTMARFKFSTREPGLTETCQVQFDGRARRMQ